MTDLSHWDFDDEFSAKQAALLIRGLDPNDTDIPDTDPVLRRLESAYEGALFERQVHHESSLETHTSDERKEWLATLKPELLHCTGMTITDEFLYSDWMFRRVGENLGAQKFSRTELARWLLAIGATSKYEFAPLKRRDTPQNNNGRKLSDSQIAEMRSKFRAGHSQKALSDEYGVSRRTVQVYLEDEAAKTEKPKKKAPAIFCSGLGGRGATR